MSEDIKVKRITLHPMNPDGSLDLETNLYPKTLNTGIVDEEGSQVELQHLTAGENIVIDENGVISAVIPEPEPTPSSVTLYRHVIYLQVFPSDTPAGKEPQLQRLWFEVYSKSSEHLLAEPTTNPGDWFISDVIKNQQFLATGAFYDQCMYGVSFVEHEEAQGELILETLVESVGGTYLVNLDTVQYYGVFEIK